MLVDVQSNKATRNVFWFTMAHLSFLFLSVNAPWIASLADSVAQSAIVSRVRFLDWYNYARLGPDWAHASIADRSLKTIALPPGYAGTLEPLFRPVIRFWLSCWIHNLEIKAQSRPFVVCPYPYLAPWVRGVAADRLIYYNFDDYSLYNPLRAKMTEKLEDELVGRSTHVFCASNKQTEKLRARHPEKAERITHLCNGVPDAFFADNFSSSAEGLPVGYVGNLSDRVDWHFVLETVKLCPEVTFKFAGALDALIPELAAIRHEVFGLPNVQYVGKIAQAEVGRFIQTCSMTWIPYAIDHPFNVVSCPTKIMDGLASGRPVLSTPVPESLLHRAIVHIVSTPAEVAEKISWVLEHADSERQLIYAREFSWKRQAEKFLTSLVN
jgi:teichuronic acid biosynthesis glycosyltransferase TuaH